MRSDVGDADFVLPLFKVERPGLFNNAEVLVIDRELGLSRESGGGQQTGQK